MKQMRPIALSLATAALFCCRTRDESSPRWQPTSVTPKQASIIFAASEEGGNELRKAEPVAPVLDATFQCAPGMRLRPLFDEKVEHAIDLLRYLERDRASVYWKNEYGQTSSRTIRAGEAFESCKARVDVPEVTLALKYYVHYANRPGGIFEYRLLRLADGNWYFYDLLSPSSAGCGGG